MRYIFFSISILMLTFAVACIPVKEEKLTEIKFDIKDKTIQNLFDLQDQQKTDSLLPYFSAKDPTHRYCAAMAFASFKNPDIIDSLAQLLNDEVDEVRIAAAFALGQQGNVKAQEHLVNAFVSNDSTGKAQQFNGTILESIGKCANEEYLQYLSTVSTYLRQDTFLLEGQTWGIYRFALRGITDQKGTEKMISYISKDGYPQSVRVIAGNYLYRASTIRLDSFAAPLIKSFKAETDPDLRMVLAVALGKTKSPLALQTLIENLRTESDYRVKTNTIRAFKNFEYKLVQSTILELLDDKNNHVSCTAGDFLIENGIPYDANFYRRKARDTTLNWQLKAKLQAAGNKHLSYYYEEQKSALNWRLKAGYPNIDNPQEKIAILNAIAEDGWNYKFFRDIFSDKAAAVRSAAVNGLAKIVANPKFNRQYGERKTRIKNKIIEDLTFAITNGDAGMQAIAAGAISNENADFKTLIEDYSFLEEAKNKLELPKEIETYNAIQKAIDFFSGEKTPITEPQYNHPLNWRRINFLGEEPKAVITTAQGKITLDLFPNETPGTVSNFVELAKRGFYDGKTFHRVVSNFVIQGGCPKGDGYGALDYTIRSEFSLRHFDDEGYIGMASSGPHTESTQFFITHSPAPHLDGKYTIFGKVTEGMDIVHKIFEGEVITKVEILD